jgi:hypothetical protein
MTTARISNIALDADEDPREVTVVLSINVAAWLARHVGKLNPSTEESSALYDCLVGSLFNRFYEDGVNDWTPKGATR